MQKIRILLADLVQKKIGSLGVEGNRTLAMIRGARGDVTPRDQPQIPIAGGEQKYFACRLSVRWWRGRAGSELPHTSISEGWLMRSRGLTQDVYSAARRRVKFGEGDDSSKVYY
jgi:hypothetical protein